jgi:hypothetical protein
VVVGTVVVAGSTIVVGVGPTVVVTIDVVEAAVRIESESPGLAVGDADGIAGIAASDPAEVGVDPAGTAGSTAGSIFIVAEFDGTSGIPL